MQNMHTFAVPTMLIRTLALAAPPEAVRLGLGVPATADGFDIIVDMFEFADFVSRETAIAQMMNAASARGRALVVESCKMGDTYCVLLAAKESLAESVSVAETPDVRLMNRAEIEAELQDMRRFSCFIGLRLLLCSDSPYVAMPFPESPGTIYLFSHARPPGISVKHKMPVKNLFGIAVWKDEEIRMVGTPVRGRGRLIEENGTSVLQVLGSNYYQLCLVYGDRHDPQRRGMIFRKLLGLLYRDLVEQYGRATSEPPELTEEEFVAFAAERAAETMKQVREWLREAEDEIKKKEEELAEKLRDRQKFIIRLRAFSESSFVRELHERLPRELAALKSIDGVVRVRIAEGGLHLETMPIVLESGGRRYDLGSFVVRLDPDGMVEVWSDSPRHPEGHHHPHIDRKNLTCYGNVTVAISKYMAAYRYADAARLVMRWLVTYSPETTLNPLEGWPAIDERKEEHRDRTDVEPVAATQDL